MKFKDIATWVGVIAILIGGLLLLINFVNSSSSPSAPVEVPNLPPVSKDDFVRVGPQASQSARVTLIEYSDFQCPACGYAYSLVKDLEKNFPKDLRVVYRFFPLIQTHQNALISSEAAYAAGLQNKFWEMHDMLFENQESWSNNPKPQDIFLGYAEKLGLNIEKFKADMNSESTIEFIKSSENKAISLGINSTPTFFVNGKMIQNPRTYEEFRRVIQDALTK